MSIIRAEFQYHHLNDLGANTCRSVEELFTDLLTALERVVPAGRERALVVTKLQEASMFAKRAIALDPRNQTP